MKKFYESYNEFINKNNIILGFSKPEETSQFLDSRPQKLPCITFIPMTGEGIEADVDDLDFCSKEVETINFDSNKENTKTLGLEKI